MQLSKVTLTETKYKPILVTKNKFPKTMSILFLLISNSNVICIFNEFPLESHKKEFFIAFFVVYNICRWKMKMKPRFLIFFCQCLLSTLKLHLNLELFLYPFFLILIWSVLKKHNFNLDKGLFIEIVQRYSASLLINFLKFLHTKFKKPEINDLLSWQVEVKTFGLVAPTRWKRAVTQFYCYLVSSYSSVCKNPRF